MAVESSSDLIKIGQITAPHGVRGEVRVYPLTDFPERFTTLRQVLIGPEARPVGIRCRGTLKNLLIVEIDGVADRDQAEKLRLQYLQVPKSEVHPLPEGSYYVFDLIGLDVVDPEGNPLGKLVAVTQESPAHDIYVVETAPRKRYMVPAVKTFVKQIDLPGGKVVIQPIPGLLEDLV
ncbi:MAG TPA: ribosome maturation factor RimM [Symbiobacteriaceae bacterium]|nr:ribosome maturation factor RimM [Symbiobacteriaceae bacterium]